MTTPYSILALLSGGLMIIAGMALISCGMLRRREALEAHINDVMHRPGGKLRLIVSSVRENEIELIKHPLYGLSEQEQREAVRLFSRFGVSPDYVMTFFNVFRGVSAVFIGLIAALLTTPQYAAIFGQPPLRAFIFVVIMAALGGVLPVFIIRYLSRRRASLAAEALPDALELLVVCVEAGLALEDGLSRIVVELKHSRPEIAEELAITAADLKILPSRDLALAKLAMRIDTPSIHSVVSTLSQSLSYGTPLAQAMRSVAADIRSDALIELEEKANRLPTLMTIPMMLLIMPTLFIIIGGPAALKLMDHFKL